MARSKKLREQVRIIALAFYDEVHVVRHE